MRRGGTLWPGVGVAPPGVFVRGWLLLSRVVTGGGVVLSGLRYPAGGLRGVVLGLSLGCGLFLGFCMGSQGSVE